MLMVPPAAPFFYEAMTNRIDRLRTATIHCAAFMGIFAYVDPGSGLLAWQMVVAACVGALFYVKKFRTFLGKVARKLFGR
jgi:hypothetical protein